MFIFSVLRLLVYILSCVFSIPAIYILTFHTKLHRNFRAILMFMTLSGYLITMTTAITVTMEQNSDIVNSQEWQQISSFSMLFGAIVYVIASINLTFERLIAFCFVKTYENLSTSFISLILICLSIILPSVLISILAVWWSWITVVVFTVCGAVGGLISLYLRYKQKVIVADMNRTLQSKFQHNENIKTTPIYLGISLNELISAIISGFIFPFVDGHELNENKYDFAGQAIHLIGAYRVLFVHCFIIVYWYMDNMKKKNLICGYSLRNGEATDEHFKQMNNLWRIK